MNVNVCSINPQKRDFVHGYIRRLQRITSNNSFLVMPQAIINIILLYFYELKINTQTCGQNLRFIHKSDGSAIATKLNDGCCSTFVFGDTVSQKYYRKWTQFMSSLWDTLNVVIQIGRG